MKISNKIEKKYMDHRSYYKKNANYSHFLDSQEKNDFKKYTDVILRYSKNGSKFLDVGCGTGISIKLINQSKKRKCSGIDISESSIKRCKEKGLDFSVYKGEKLPFEDNFFDIVGSINVLEHVNEPHLFLDEKLRVYKKGGYLVIVCPNFLSITNSYHYHTAGIIQKIKNIFSLMKIFLKKPKEFEKMKPVFRKEFKADDDAVNITNPLTILHWAKQKNINLVYWSSQTVYKKSIANHFDFSLFRIFFGSSFFVFKKK